MNKKTTKMEQSKCRYFSKLRWHSFVISWSLRLRTDDILPVIKKWRQSGIIVTAGKPPIIITKFNAATAMGMPGGGTISAPKPRFGPRYDLDRTEVWDGEGIAGWCFADSFGVRRDCLNLKVVKIAQTALPSGHSLQPRGLMNRDQDGAVHPMPER